MGAVLSGRGQSRTVRPNALLLVSGLVLLLVSTAMLPVSRGLLGVALAMAGFLVLLFYKQQTVVRSGDPDYVQYRWADRLLSVGLVASLVLTVAHLYPWAEGIATGACACL